MPGIDHGHHVRRRVNVRHGHGHEPPADSPVAEMAVDLSQDLRRADPAADQVADFRADAGDHERGRHPFAGDIADRHGPPRRTLRCRCLGPRP